MQPRRSLLLSFLSLIVFGLSTNASAQGPDPRFTIEPSYDVVLQVVIGGDDKSGSRLPEQLGGRSADLEWIGPRCAVGLGNSGDDFSDIHEP